MQRSQLALPLALCLALCLGLLAGACTSTSTPNGSGPLMPGVSADSMYDGPAPSARGQKVLHSLRGHKFVDRDKQIGGGVWTVGNYSVGESINGEMQPMLFLSQGTTDIQIPMLSDGDANYIYSIAMNEVAPMQNLELSSECKSAIRDLGRR